jgi:hypothetical protein
MITIEEIYSELIREGITRNFVVVPEFSIIIDEWPRPKKFDLVWLVERERFDPTQSGSLKKWKIIAAFEIEGCDVPIARVVMHVNQLKDIHSKSNEPFKSFLLLYSKAYHRKNTEWNKSSTAEKLIAKRKDAIKTHNGNDLLSTCGCDLPEWTKLINT